MNLRNLFQTTTRSDHRAAHHAAPAPEREVSAAYRRYAERKGLVEAEMQADDLRRRN